MTQTVQLPIAMAQINTSVGDIQSNCEKIMHGAQRAYEQGARVVVFPEMTITGYPIEDLALRATFRRASDNAVNALAKRLEESGYGDLYVVIGTVGSVHKGERGAYKLVDTSASPTGEPRTSEPTTIARPTGTSSTNVRPTNAQSGASQPTEPSEPATNAQSGATETADTDKHPRAHLQQSQAHLQQANTQLTACSFFTRGALPTPTINSSCQITEFSTNSVFSHQDTIISSSISMDTARASQSVRIFGKTTVPHRN